MILFNFNLYKDLFFFVDAQNTRLTLMAGSLSYVPNRKYEILVTTTNFNIEYYQKVRINIEAPPQLPISLIE